MTEADYQRAVQAALEKVGAKVIKTNGSPFMEKGTPDLIGCYNGRMFVIETKLSGNTTTVIQQRRLKEWENAGAIALVATYPQDTPHQIAT